MDFSKSVNVSPRTAIGVSFNFGDQSAEPSPKQSLNKSPRSAFDGSTFNEQQSVSSTNKVKERFLCRNYVPTMYRAQAGENYNNRSFLMKDTKFNDKPANKSFNARDKEKEISPYMKHKAKTRRESIGDKIVKQKVMDLNGFDTV